MVFLKSSLLHANYSMQVHLTFVFCLSLLQIPSHNFHWLGVRLDISADPLEVESNYMVVVAAADILEQCNGMEQ